MKMNFNFSKLIDNNKFLRVLSVLIAIIVWFLVVITLDPTESTYITKIPVNFDLTDTTPGKNDLSVIEGLGQTVDVKVEGKKYKIGNLSNVDFVAVPNLNAVSKSGEYDITIHVKKANEKDPDYYVVSEPKTIKVKFDRIKNVSLPIVALAENVSAKQGFYIEEVYADEKTIDLSGPESEVDKIARCVVSTDAREVIDEITTYSGNLVFLDENNNKLTFKYTTFTERTYEIAVIAYKRITVPFKVNFVNVPQGFELSNLNYSLSIPEIEIAGGKNLIDDIKEITLDGEVDFRNIDIGYTTELSVSLVAGIKNVDNISSVTISFEDADLESKQFALSNIITKNEPANLNVKLSTKFIYNVKIVGSKEDLAKLLANDLIAVVDLTNIAEGDSRVPVSIYATGNKFVWAVGEYSILASAKPK